MSQTSRPSQGLEPSGEYTTFAEMRGAVRRHRGLVLRITGAAMALALVVSLIVPAVYESEALLRVRSERPGGGMFEEMTPLVGLDLGLGTDEVDTEVGVLQSRRLMEAVADSLDLHVKLLTPFRPRGEIVEILSAGPDAVRGRYSFRRTDRGTYLVSRAPTGGRRGAPPEITPGEPFAIGNMTLAILPAPRGAEPGRIRLKVSSFNETVEDLREDVKVSRQRSGSKLLEIKFRDRDPEIAAGVVNGLIENFLEFAVGSSRSETRNRVAVLREQVAEYERQLRDSENRLQTFREQQQVIAPEAQAEKEMERLAAMQVQHDALRVERQALTEVMRGIEGGSQPPSDASPVRRLATVPSFMANARVQNLLQTLTALENQRAELLARRTENNADVRQVSGRIGEIEDQLHQFARSYRAGLDEQISSLEQALGRFDRELAMLPARDIEFARLSRDQKLLSEVYLVLQTRLREAEVQDAIEDGNVRVVDSGIVADEPVFPKPLVNTALGAVLGLMLGFAAAIGREMSDTKVRSRADAEEAAAGLPVLATIPRLPGQVHRRERVAGARTIRFLRGAPGGAEERFETPLVLARHDPWSPASDAYRTLITGVARAGDLPPRVLAVTSPLPGDGKSTVAANLAVILAQREISTLLVDTDLRRGRLHESFNVELQPGLTQLLLGECSLEEAIRTVTPVAGGRPVHLITSGGLPRGSSELLGFERLRGAVETFRERFDAVILDVAPVNLVADAAVVGGLAESALLVVRNGATERPALAHAVAQLRRFEVPIAGIVINDAEPEPGTDYGVYAASGAGVGGG